MTGDVLTAPADSIPRRRAGALTLEDCWRSFIRRSSPRLLGLAILGALVLRGLLGDLSWRDAVWVVGLVAVTPPVEWLIHVYILHAKPVRLGRFSLDLMAAQEHRAHHREPSILNGVLIPAYAIFIFVPMIAITIWVLSFPIALILGGDRLAQASTGLVVAYVILASYEWCHYLIHTPYRPRSRYYRSISRGHRLHHYKNEHYWFGVTSTVGDHLLGTAPEQSSVSRSTMARTLETSRQAFQGRLTCLRTYVRMTSDGSPYQRFRRALATGNPALVTAAALELPRVALDDALRICLVLRGGDRERYERAAVRWLGRFALEGRGVTIGDLRAAAEALALLPERAGEAMERLQTLCLERGVG